MDSPVAVVDLERTEVVAVMDSPVAVVDLERTVQECASGLKEKPDSPFCRNSGEAVPDESEQKAQEQKDEEVQRIKSVDPDKCVSLIDETRVSTSLRHGDSDQPCHPFHHGIAHAAKTLARTSGSPSHDSAGSSYDRSSHDSSPSSPSPSPAEPERLALLERVLFSGPALAPPHAERLLRQTSFDDEDYVPLPRHQELPMFDMAEKPACGRVAGRVAEPTCARVENEGHPAVPRRFPFSRAPQARCVSSPVPQPGNGLDEAGARSPTIESVKESSGSARTADTDGDDVDTSGSDVESDASCRDVVARSMARLSVAAEASKVNHPSGSGHHKANIQDAAGDHSEKQEDEYVDVSDTCSNGSMLQRSRTTPYVSSVALRQKEALLANESYISGTTSETSACSSATNLRRSPQRPYVSGTALQPGSVVVLHVYDVSTNVGVQWINSLLNHRLSPVKAGGFFHVGVEVFGLEWSFGRADKGTGVRWKQPGVERAHNFRETVPLGLTNLTSVEVAAMLRALENEYMGDSYDIVNKNCVDFACELARRLGVGPVPSWVSRLSSFRQGTETSTPVVPQVKQDQRTLTAQSQSNEGLGLSPLTLWVAEL